MLLVFENELLPLLADSPDLDLSDLYRLDQRDGINDPIVGLRRTYEYMIGVGAHSDTIAVERSVGGSDVTYDWHSGRHRSFVAAHLGWKFVPGRIVGAAR